MNKRMSSEMNFVADIHKHIDNFNIIKIQISKSNKILILCRNNIKSMHETEIRYDYRIIEIDGERISFIDLLDQNFYYNFVQNIDKDNYLLVGARCEYYSPVKQDNNGKIIDKTGETIREFVLGDGIQDVYIDNNNYIWTSYFDEGIYGNYGWDNKPIGACGLIAWDKFGKQIYRYDGSNTGHYIDDCYALNICNNGDVWFYYYSEFILAKRKRDGDIKYFKTGISGSDGFVVWNDYVLFRGGYDNHNEYQLFKLNSDKELQIIDKVIFTIDGGKIESSIFSCRDSRIVYLIDKKIYELRLESILKDYM